MIRRLLIVLCAILCLYHTVDGVPLSVAGPGTIDVHTHLWWPRSGEGGGQGGGGPGKGKGSGGPPLGRRRPLHGMGPGGGPGRAGVGGGDTIAQAAQNLIAHMDRYGVAKAVILPPPQSPQNADATHLDELLKVAAKYPSRLVVAGGGEVLNPMIHGTPADQASAAVKTTFRTAADKLVRRGVKAFGEMTALHLSFKSGHPFEMVAPDHPLFLVLADLAAQYGIPIDLHMEAVPADMKLPSGFKSPNAGVLKANIAGFERLLAHNRRANIVWQHIGWDNTGHMTPALLRRLLAAHPNLFLALRVEIRGQSLGGQPMPNRIVQEGGKIDPDWLAVIKEFPDRFMIGTDEFFTAAQSQKRWPQSFEETWPLVGRLPPDLASKVGRDNAARVYKL
jgi:predicted TIM-barrel fold metal-dependent hydrolase